MKYQKPKNGYDGEENKKRGKQIFDIPAIPGLWSLRNAGAGAAGPATLAAKGLEVAKPPAWAGQAVPGLESIENVLCYNNSTRTGFYPARPDL